jgi:hypothetical protein
VCATEISDEKEEGVVFRSVNNSYVRNKWWLTTDHQSPFLCPSGYMND